MDREWVQQLVTISDAEFRQLADLIYSRFGIHLTEQKKSLLVGRLNKVLRRENHPTFESYYQALKNDQTGDLLSEFIDRVSTNHSYFYREKEHYDYLTQVILPQTEQKHATGPIDFRIWSAGCAAGEEVYTLAMTLQEYQAHSRATWDFGLLATDISETVLHQASKGIYDENKLNDLPAGWKQKYMTEEGTQNWKVKAQLKEMVLFKKLNLMDEVYPFKGHFDIIFCRNVMIYFDQKTRHDLVLRYHRYIKPGGYLFIGHSESLPREWNFFRYVKPAVYQKVS